MSNRSARSRTNDFKASQAAVRFPLWVSIAVILGALLTVTGAVISKVDPTLLTGGGAATETARVYADYALPHEKSYPWVRFPIFFLLSRESSEHCSPLFSRAFLVRKMLLFVSGRVRFLIKLSLDVHRLLR